jgi:SAM-dependent methyltransferase
MIGQLWGKGGGLLSRGNGRDDRSSTVFVASTQEAVDAGWLLKALAYAEERLTKDEVDVRFEPWNEAFGAGEITAEKLVLLSRTVGAAIVVLSADDSTDSRGVEIPAPRDNLVFEAGLFLGQLDRGRVLLLREQDSKIPTDLLGVSIPSYRKADEDTPSNVAIQDLGRQIAEFVKSAFEDSSQQGSDSSVTRAIIRSLARLDGEVVDVRNAISGPAEQADPIEMPDAPMAYVDAVHEVRETFLTTTYLDSAFWTMRDLPVIEANERLLKRLKENEGGKAKRLILLSRSVADEVKSQRERRRSLRSIQPKQVDQMDKEFKAFAKANRDLVESGFEVKVVYDRDELWKDLPDGMHFSSGDTELAVFDEDRIDIYSGFAGSGLPAARVFGRTIHRSFDPIYEMTLSYMNELWASDHAQDFSTFAKELEEVIFESQFEIDYERNWLLKFDSDANEGDARLKRAEMKFVVEAIESRTRSKAADGHLDLGTCTGRYLLSLRPFLDSGSTSVGVDIDLDCVGHCERKEELQDKRQFNVVDGDIREAETLPKDSFDLVTCMMGTLCHLRRNVNSSGEYDDPWQTGLDNLANRLAMDGDAFVAIWSGESGDSNGAVPPTLSIYPRRSTDILLKQSPSKEEFDARLRQAGLRSVKDALIERRLHVYHLQHA